MKLYILNVYNIQLRLGCLRRDPVEAVVQKSDDTNVDVERKAEPFKGITVKELNVRWEAAVVDLAKKGIDVMNLGHALEGALSIRYVSAPNVIMKR